jgi:hypothetical protein
MATAHTFPQIDTAHIAAIEAAAAAYRAEVTAANSDTGFYAMQAEVRLMEAVNVLWPDWLGDLIAERTAEIADNYNCRVDGRPLDAMELHPAADAMILRLAAGQRAYVRGAL